MSRWGIDAGLEDRFGVYFPHQHLVPRDPIENTRYRLKVWSTSSDLERRRIRQRCKEDFLYYLMTFVSIFQAKEDPKPVPFIPYDFQFECFTVLWKCLHDGQEDCRIIKPRDMGVTWLILCLYEHAWHFFPDRQFLLGSRKEDEVDGTTDDQGTAVAKAGEWSTLFGKLDFIHLKQPTWMLPRGYKPRCKPFRTSLKDANPENGSLFKGESANPKFGRSGRYFGIGFDEHAHTEYGYKIIGSCSATSDCHFWFSSPDGPQTAFAMLGRAPIRQIRLEWWMHPGHAEGMVHDKEKGDKGRWSPWLSKALARIGYDAKLANDEIWADESQSGGAYFRADLFQLMLQGLGVDQPATVRDPLVRGELDIRVSPEDGPWVTGFNVQGEGRWLLWTAFDSEGRPPRNDRYIITADVAGGSTDSSGRGASNSAIVVISELQRAKVAEFATHGVPPHKLAVEFVAAARFFCGKEGHAYMNWDAGGPGGLMGDVITGQDDYNIRDNMYYRVTHDKGVKPGYIRPKNAEENLKPWGQFEKMLWEGRYFERSVDTVDEMRHYNSNPTGGAPIHAASQTKDDPSGARENHGDRTTATVLGCMELAKRKGGPERDADAPPYGSILHARQLQRRAEREKQLI